jgi:pimeloyl-ACP methyl ester carboxylesterase
MTMKQNMKWIFFFIILVLVFFYIRGDKETMKLDNEFRQHKQGSFIRLSNGYTHYELTGPKTGRVVVLIHGLSIPMFDWDLQIEALTSAGYRVLRYDHFGRGYSDRPRAEYNRSFYVNQLLELLDELKIKGPINLVAHSFGGGIAAEFTVRNPELVDRVVFLAPVYHVAKDNIGVKLVSVPLLGSYLARLILVSSLTKRANAIFADSNLADTDSFKERFAQQTQIEGFEQSVISMFRSDALDSYETTYASLGKQDRKMLLVWGDNDGSVSHADIENIQRLIPTMEFELLPGVNHSPNLQVPERFNSLILKFLQE